MTQHVSRGHHNYVVLIQWSNKKLQAALKKEHNIHKTDVLLKKVKKAEHAH